MADIVPQPREPVPAVPDIPAVGVQMPQRFEMIQGATRSQGADVGIRGVVYASGAAGLDVHGAAHVGVGMGNEVGGSGGVG